MNTSSRLLYSASSLAELDRRAALQGLPPVLLMERAGEAAFGFIRTRWPEARHWLILAGGGNNGGDGYVVARLAHLAGLTVTVAALKPPPPDGPAAAAASAYQGCGGALQPLGASLAAGADLVVDALFGIGLDRPPRGPAAEIIDKLNRASLPVAAVDIPSGVQADTGAVAGAAVRADLTVTFIGLKPGLFTGAGVDHVGRLEFAGLGVPEALAADLRPRAQLIEGDELNSVLPARSAGAHKGRFGHVLVIGGERGFAGAPCLAGVAAARAGAGLVSVLTRPEHVVGIVGVRPELMAHASTDGVLSPALLERANVLALGPGLGQSPWSRALWRAALDASQPLVLDADGLNLLAGDPRRREDWILTPHPGEAARLLETTVGAIEADRIRSIQRLVERFEATVVLKGAGSLVLSPGEGMPWLCDRGNPGMASGGMGDALTGVIAALRAQGLDASVAARLGVWIHACAGDRAAARGGSRGLLAGDLIDELRAVVNPS